MSATTGIPRGLQTSEIAGMSATSSCGLVIISRNRQHVSLSTACFMALMSVRSTSRASMPNRFKVVVIRAKVLPNRWRDVTMFLPDDARASIVFEMAAIPELTAITSCASVIDLTRFSKFMTVGLVTRE